MNIHLRKFSKIIVKVVIAITLKAIALFHFYINNKNDIRHNLHF